MNEIEIKYYNTKGELIIEDVINWGITLDSNGFLHSYKDQPAKKDFHDRGSGEVNIYFSHGFLHRLKGPAIIVEDFSVSPQCSYFINGKQFNKKNDWELEAHRLLMLEEL